MNQIQLAKQAMWLSAWGYHALDKNPSLFPPGSDGRTLTVEDMKGKFKALFAVAYHRARRLSEEANSMKE